jgi:hypothetical protein
MQNKIKAAVIISFFGDAMAMGLRWFKNQKKIIQHYDQMGPVSIYALIADT